MPSGPNRIAPPLWLLNGCPTSKIISSVDRGARSPETTKRDNRLRSSPATV